MAAWIPRAFLTLLLLMPTVGVAESQKSTKPLNQAALSVGTADIILPRATEFALFRHAAEGVPRLYLYMSGDVLMAPAQSLHGIVVEWVDNRGVRLRWQDTGRVMTVRPSEVVPGLHAIVYQGMVKVRRLEYRFMLVDRVQHPVARLLRLEGEHAVVEQEVDHLPAPLAATPPTRVSEESQGKPVLDPKLLKRVQVRTVGADIYELDKAALQPVLDEAAVAISELNPGAFPASLVGGSNIPLTSPLANGVLGSQGFQITDPQLSQFLGLRVGDTVVSLNGRPVNSPLNAWWTFQDVLINTHGLQDVRLGVIRNGQPTTKLYLLR